MTNIQTKKELNDEYQNVKYILTSGMRTKLLLSLYEHSKKLEEIRNDFEERLEQGDTVYGIEILDDYVETIRKGSITYIIAQESLLFNRVS